MTTPLFLLRCVQIGLHISELDLLTIGMVNEMYAESRNDECQDSYNQLASQEDMDRRLDFTPEELERIGEVDIE